MKSPFSAFALIVALFFSSSGYSQIGQPSTNFNVNDLGYNSGVSADATIYSVAKLNDGSVVIGGEFLMFNSINVRRIAKLNPNGIVDEGFINGTNFNGIVREVYVQNDGKILVGGDFTMYNTSAKNRIIRLNADGSIDGSFNVGTGASAPVKVFAEQPDGKILVGGEFSSFNGQSVFRIVRLNADGTIDPGFQTAIGLNQFVQAICIQPDGKILVGGSFSSFNGQSTGSLVRLNADGSLDANFTSTLGTGVLSYVQKIVYTSNNQIIVAGGFTSVAGVSQKGITRLNSDGSLDFGFNTGTGFNFTGSNGVYDIEIDSSDRIVVSGAFTGYNGNSAMQVARLNADGTFDATFNGGIGVDSGLVVFDLCLQNNNSSIFVGNFPTFNGEAFEYITQLNSDGTINQTFCGNNAFQSGYVQVFKELPDGRILVGGYFDSYFGETTYSLIMINQDGSRDYSFNIGQGLNVNGSIQSIEIDNAGNFLVGGLFTSIDGQSVSNLAKISPDGTVDTSFNPNPNGSVWCILIEQDNDVIVGGNFTTLDGQAQQRLGRVNQFGVYDQWFLGGANAVVKSLAWMPDGTIIAGGDFSTVGGSNRNKISHLNNTGGSLFDFNGSGIVGTFYSLQVQSDGKIVVAGNLVSYNGTPVKNPFRINTDGTLDNTFNVGTGSSGTIASVHKTFTQSDMKVIAVGEFTSMNGTPVGRIVRLNSNGSVDNTFNTQTGANNAIRTITQLSSGEYLIGGDFTAFNSIGRNRIALIESCSPSNSSLDAVSCDTYTLNNVEYTSSGVYNQTITNAAGCDSIITLNLEILNSSTLNSTETSCGPFYWNNIQYNESGFYSQTFANSVGCDSILTLDLTVFNLNMNVNLTGNTLTAAEIGAQYQWLDCTNGSVEIPNATGQSYTPSTNGSYAVIVSENGCSDVSLCVDVNTINGIEEIDILNHLSIAPNPFADILNITISGAGKFNLEILNALGEIVFKDEIINRTAIDTSALSEGVYIVRCFGKRNVISKAIVK